MRDELAWLNLGVAGLAIAAMSNATWLLRGRESVSFGRVALLPGAAAIAELVDPCDLYLRLEHREQSGATFATGDRLARYHRPDCPFIAGRSVELDGRDVFERNGLLPCEVCEP
jgi:hypothetical protein